MLQSFVLYCVVIFFPNVGEALLMSCRAENIDVEIRNACPEFIKIYVGRTSLT